ncbi:MAG: TRAP transporter small permease [Pseudomonadota bacterium]|nr:TRAP transporter small permease [Pseudomonadota bacterium]
MKTFQKIVFFVSQAAATLAAVIIIYMVCHILLEIFVRTVFSTSTFALDELIGYSVAACAYLGLGYTLEKGGLIRVNLVLSKINPLSGARKVIEILCCIGTLIAMGLPLWYFGRSVIRKYESGYTSGTMLNAEQWIPESFLLVGLVIFWIQLLAYTLRVVNNQVDLDATRAANLGIE